MGWRALPLRQSCGPVFGIMDLGVAPLVGGSPSLNTMLDQALKSVSEQRALLVGNLSNVTG